MTAARIAALRSAIAALEAQRGLLGDEALQLAVAPLRVQLAALQPAPPQLRLVSVLFLDVVGSTALSGRLEPEEISSVLDGALRRYAAVLQAHGGRVLEYAGDSVLAAFGVDGVQEDDAERAVKAGLALLEAAREQSEAMRAREGIGGLKIRVGVHSGIVLPVSGVGGRDGIRGVTVHIAARMEQTAPPGALRISHDTWRLVQGLFEMQAQPPLVVKGRDEPMATWLVLRALPEDLARRTRGVDGVATPLLDRDADLALLHAALADVRATGRPRALTLLAEPGLGKTRLIAEWRQQLEAEADAAPALRGRGQSAAQGQPYGLLRRMLAARLGLADSDSAGVARERWLAGTRAALGTPDAPLDTLGLRCLGQLIGLDHSDDADVAAQPPRALRTAALAALQRLLAAWGGGGPLVLIADDLHWADDATLELWRELTLGTVPLLLLGCARPALLERRPGWAEALGEAHALRTLSPLEPAAGRALAEVLLQHVHEPPSALPALLVERADGNPYYMEELVKMLVDTGVLRIDGEHWHVMPERLGRLQVPGTLAGVLQARLDALEAAERHALQQASIIGPVFWDDALARLAPPAPPMLPALQHKALVVPRLASSFEGTAEETFRHHLLHQVTYEGVPRSVRREGHARAAAWLAERARAGEHLAATAEHYLQAGDHPQAARWLCDAMDHALARFDNVTAIAHGQRALELAGDGELALQWRAHLAIARAADVLSNRELHVAYAASMERLAAAEGADPAWAGRARYTRANLLFRQGRVGEALQAATEAAAACEAAGATFTAAEAHNLRCVVARIQGDLATARAAGTAGVALAAGPGMEATRGRLQVNLALVDLALGDTDRAGQLVAEAVASFTRLGDAAMLVPSLLNLGSIRHDLGDYEGAVAAAGEAVVRAQALGDRLHAAAARVPLGGSLMRLGHLDAARAELQQAVDGLIAVGDTLTLPEAWLHRGDVEAAAGLPGEALACYATSRELYAAAGQPTLGLLAQAGGALVLAGRGDVASALADLEPVLAHLGGADAADPLSASLPLRWSCAQVLAAAGDPRAAGELDAVRALVSDQAARIEDDARRGHFLRSHWVARAISANAESPWAPGGAAHDG